MGQALAPNAPRGPSLSVRVMFSVNITLAHLLDSLVRVSRRADEPHRSTNAVSKPTYAGKDYGRRAFITRRNRGKPLACWAITTLLTTIFSSTRNIVHPFKFDLGAPERDQKARHQDNGGHDALRGLFRGTFHQDVLDSSPSLTSRRLQVLFHSLSKVLFIFRSRYLCAIGLPMIFSLNRGIPAVRTAFPSSTTRARTRFVRRLLGLRGYHPLWRSFPGKLFRGQLIQARTYTTIPLRGFGLDISQFARRYYGNHSCFLFLRLMICLSSARGLPQLRP